MKSAYHSTRHLFYGLTTERMGIHYTPLLFYSTLLCIRSLRT